MGAASWMTWYASGSWVKFPKDADPRSHSELNAIEGEPKESSDSRQHSA